MKKKQRRPLLQHRWYQQRQPRRLPQLPPRGGGILMPALKPDDATPEIEPLNAPTPALESLSAEQRARIEENKQSAKKRKLLMMAKKEKR